MSFLGAGEADEFLNDAVNAMSASSDGRAWYADGSASPRLSEEAISLWEAEVEANPITRAFFDFGIVLLDGGDSRFEWVDEGGARDPGLVPHAKQPPLERHEQHLRARMVALLASDPMLEVVLIRSN